MSEFKEYWSGTVLPEQVDNLGHMNVRFYGIHGDRAAKILLEEIGVTPEVLAPADAGIYLVDTYTRHYAEQTEGSPLLIRGGICAAQADGISVYFEMINRDTGTLAATFIQKAVLLDGPHRAPQPFTGDILANADERRVEIPEHGMPRSLDLDHLRSDVTADDLDRRGLPRGSEATIGPEFCDAYGFLIIEHPYSLLAAIGMQMKNVTGVPTYDQPDGSRVAGVTMESRNVLLETPRAGDRIASYYGVVHIEGKISERRHWNVNTGTGRLVSVTANIDLSFDLTTRRPVPTPENMIASFKERYHPDLR